MNFIEIKINEQTVRLDMSIGINIIRRRAHVELPDDPGENLGYDLDRVMIVPRLACHRTWWDGGVSGLRRTFRRVLFVFSKIPYFCTDLCIFNVGIPMFYVSCMSTLPPCSSVSSVSLSILRKMQHQQQPSPVCGVLPPPAYAALPPPPAPASAPQSVGAYQTSL